MAHVTNPAVRVEIEYADGKVMRLVGEGAEKFTEQVAGAAVMARAHGVARDVLPWVIVHPARGETPR